MSNAQPTPAVRKLVRSPWKKDGAAGITKLSPCDQTAVAVATARAVFWPARFDWDALEQCLILVLEDLPFLGGRLAPVKLPVGWKIGDLAVANTNDGAELTLVEAPHLTLGACGPDSWPMRGVTISSPQLPPYLAALDTGKALLTGVEPLCKVRLTRLADGDVLGITLSHTVTDGMHWPALLVHIAARYRQAAGGKLAPAQELIDGDTGKSGLLVAKMRAVLPGCSGWEPQPFEVKPVFTDYWRAGGLLWANSSKKVQFDILHLPRQRLADLKAAVAEGSDQPVTSGDVVQALAAMLVHAAEGKPLVPVLPKVMLALLQIPGVDPKYFGNAVHPLAVGMPAGAPLPPENDYLGALRTLAARIRACTAEIRATPAKALQALYESERVCGAPAHKSLAYLAGRRFPFVTCTTNYIGTLAVDSSLDFGLGVKHLGTRHLTTPLAASMAVVRPAMAPYGEGLFIQMTFTVAQAKQLRQHPLLRALAPDASFVGPKEVATP